MKALVHRGRIRILLDPDDEVPFGEPTKAEILGAVIGSLSEKDGILSCALSAQNFRRLRAQGCKLVDDHHTRSVVAKMRQELDLYLAETADGERVKKGGLNWDLQFKLPPFKHQVLGINFLRAMRAPALFGDCGTGKTYMVATLVENLIRSGEDYVAIVICPINLIKHVWIADISKFTDLSALSLRGPDHSHLKNEDWEKGADKTDPIARKKALAKAKLRRRKVLDQLFQREANFYVLNYEQLRLDPMRKRLQKLCRRLLDAGKKLCLVVDESSRIKSRTSATYRALKTIRHHHERCIIMTGTPSPNGILDLWAQFSLLDGGHTLQPSFLDYRKDVAIERELRGVTWVDKQGVKRTATKWFPKPGSSLQVHRMVQARAIRFRTDDCIDLPASRFIVRDVELNAEQAAAYEDMEERLFTELEGKPVTAKVAVGKLMKLREITGGFLLTDKGEAVQLGKQSPKILELDDLLAQCIADKLGDGGPPHKALVWAQYQWECQTLLQRYRTLYGSRGLFGGISTGAKEEGIRRFRSDPSCRLLVCHPASAGHGLNLTEASFAFYYSLSYNYEETYQSLRRLARPGQTRPMTFFFLTCPDTIDEDLLDVTQDKKNLSDLITDGHVRRDAFIERRGKRKTSQIDINLEITNETPAAES